MGKPEHEQALHKHAPSHIQADSSRSKAHTQTQPDLFPPHSARLDHPAFKWVSFYRNFENRFIRCSFSSAVRFISAGHLLGLRGALPAFRPSAQSAEPDASRCWSVPRAFRAAFRGRGATLRDAGAGV